ncbi:hypothetical protein ACF053_15755 [Streptomyces kanasensis]|uniref:hypothetical protein n=1 Tax=Streptomyces kanasensis TaxID=936756 RepID=UPI0036FA2B1C
MTGRDLKASDHPRKEVRRVLEKWTALGWALRKEGHWGRLYCPCGAGCTAIPVSGSPQNDGTHARRIDRMASRCPLPESAPSRSLTGRPRE